MTQSTNENLIKQFNSFYQKSESINNFTRFEQEMAALLKTAGGLPVFLALDRKVRMHIFNNNYYLLAPYEEELAAYLMKYGRLEEVLAVYAKTKNSVVAPQVARYICEEMGKSWLTDSNFDTIASLDQVKFDRIVRLVTANSNYISSYNMLRNKDIYARLSGNTIGKLYDHIIKQAKLVAKLDESEMKETEPAWAPHHTFNMGKYEKTRQETARRVVDILRQGHIDCSAPFMAEKRAKLLRLYAGTSHDSDFDTRVEFLLEHTEKNANISKQDRDIIFQELFNTYAKRSLNFGYFGLLYGYKDFDLNQRQQITDILLSRAAIQPSQYISSVFNFEMGQPSNNRIDDTSLEVLAGKKLDQEEFVGIVAPWVRELLETRLALHEKQHGKSRKNALTIERVTTTVLDKIKTKPELATVLLNYNIQNQKNLLTLDEIDALYQVAAKDKLNSDLVDLYLLTNEKKKQDEHYAAQAQRLEDAILAAEDKADFTYYGIIHRIDHFRWDVSTEFKEKLLKKFIKQCGSASSEALVEMFTLSGFPPLTAAQRKRLLRAICETGQSTDIKRVFTYVDLTDEEKDLMLKSLPDQSSSALVETITSAYLAAHTRGKSVKNSEEPPLKFKNESLMLETILRQMPEPNCALLYVDNVQKLYPALSHDYKERFAEKLIDLHRFHDLEPQLNLDRITLKEKLKMIESVIDLNSTDSKNVYIDCAQELYSLRRMIATLDDETLLSVVIKLNEKGIITQADGSSLVLADALYMDREALLNTAYAGLKSIILRLESGYAFADKLISDHAVLDDLGVSLADEVLERDQSHLSTSLKSIQ